MFNQTEFNKTELNSVGRTGIDLITTIATEMVTAVTINILRPLGATSPATTSISAQLSILRSLEATIAGETIIPQIEANILRNLSETMATDTNTSKIILIKPPLLRGIATINKENQ